MYRRRGSERHVKPKDVTASEIGSNVRGSDPYSFAKTVSRIITRGQGYPRISLGAEGRTVTQCTGGKNRPVVGKNRHSKVTGDLGSP